jgi:hypothetical protein
MNTAIKPVSVAKTKRRELEDARAVALALAGYRWESRNGWKWNGLYGPCVSGYVGGYLAGQVWRSHSARRWWANPSSLGAVCQSKESAMRKVERFVVAQLRQVA